MWANKDPKGWNYSDKNGTSDGVQKLQLKTGAAGKARAQVKGGRASLPLPTPITSTRYFDQNPSVIAQLINFERLCLTSEFTAASTGTNDGVQFKAKTP